MFAHCCAPFVDDYHYFRRTAVDEYAQQAFNHGLAAYGYQRFGLLDAFLRQTATFACCYNCKSHSLYFYDFL